MALKTGWRLIFLFLLAAPPLAAQTSPIQWPVPPPGPPRETDLPPVLIGPAALTRALAAGAVALDARGPARRSRRGTCRGRSRPGAPARTRIPTSPACGRGSPHWESRDRGRSRSTAKAASARQSPASSGCCAGRAAARCGSSTAASPPGGAPAAQSRPARPAAAPWRPSIPPNGPRRRTPAGSPRPSCRPASSSSTCGTRAAGERWKTPPTFAAGHIPYSLPFDPAALLSTGGQADGGWPDPAGLRRRLAALGPAPTTRCGRTRSSSSTAATAAIPAPPSATCSSPSPASTRGSIRAAGGSGGRTPRGRSCGCSRPPRSPPACGGRTPVSPATGRRATSSCSTCARPGTSGSATCPGRAACRSSLLARLRDDGAEGGPPPSGRRSPWWSTAMASTACAAGRPAPWPARLGFRDVIWFRGGIREWREGLSPPRDPGDGR